MTHKKVSESLPQRNLPKLGPEWDSDFLDVWHSAIGFYRIWVLHLGRRYGILHELAENSQPVSPIQLSRKLDLSEDALSLWCDAASAIGIVRKRGVGYSLPKRLIPLLVEEDSVRFIGGLPSYLAIRSVDFEAFDQFFKQGKSPLSQTHLGEAIKEGTIWDHIAFLRLVLPGEKELRRLLLRGAKVLDVGAGTGSWSVRLARQFPLSRFEGIDPDSVAISKGTTQVEELGLSNVRLKVQDAESMEFTSDFDVAYLGEVLNLIRPKDKVLRACHRALKEGGFLVICEGLRSGQEGMRKIENQLVHAMQLDFALQGGRFFTRSELESLVLKAGFGSVRYHDVGGGLWFIVARKLNADF